jgi:hypothetical protein
LLCGCGYGLTVTSASSCGRAPAALNAASDGANSVSLSAAGSSTTVVARGASCPAKFVSWKHTDESELFTAWQAVNQVTSLFELLQRLLLAINVPCKLMTVLYDSSLFPCSSSTFHTSPSMSIQRLCTPTRSGGHICLPLVRTQCHASTLTTIS